MSSPPGSRQNFFYRYTALRLNVKGLKGAKVAHMYEKNEHISDKYEL